MEGSQENQTEVGEAGRRGEYDFNIKEETKMFKTGIDRNSRKYIFYLRLTATIQTISVIHSCRSYVSRCSNDVSIHHDSFWKVIIASLNYVLRTLITDPFSSADNHQNIFI